MRRRFLCGFRVKLGVGRVENCDSRFTTTSWLQVEKEAREEWEAKAKAKGAKVQATLALPRRVPSLARA